MIVFCISSHKYNAWMPVSEIFNQSSIKYMKFHLIKFHNISRRLIGLDNLKLLKVKLDFEHGYLLTPNFRLHYHYQ